MSNQTPTPEDGTEDAEFTTDGDDGEHTREVQIERSPGPDVKIAHPSDGSEAVKSPPHKTCEDCGLKLQDGNDGELCLLCQDS